MVVHSDSKACLGYHLYMMFSTDEISVAQSCKPSTDKLTQADREPHLITPVSFLLTFSPSLGMHCSFLALFTGSALFHVSLHTSCNLNFIFKNCKLHSMEQIGGQLVTDK